MVIYPDRAFTIPFLWLNLCAAPDTIFNPSYSPAAHSKMTASRLELAQMEDMIEGRLKVVNGSGRGGEVCGTYQPYRVLSVSWGRSPLLIGPVPVGQLF